MTVRRQSGFATLELILVAVVVALIGYVGFKYYQQRQKPAPTAATTPAAITAATPTAPQINSTSDLDKASAALDQTNVDASSSDSSQLSSQTSNF